MNNVRSTVVCVGAACGVAWGGPPCTMGWRPDPIGVPGTSAVVRALTVYDDGTGPALYVGGPFFMAGGITVNSIAKWNGSSFSALGVGVAGPIATSAAAVNGLGVHNDGTGPALYVMGNLVQAGGQPANRIAKWNGTSWSPLGAGLNQASQALATFNDGTGDALYVGGSFTMAGSAANTLGIARWNGSEWSSVGGGLASGSCNTLLVYDDGSGPALYAGGTFTLAGGVPGTSRIARWNGTVWSELTGGVDGPNNPRVNALAVYDDGHGAALYAGGLFTSAGGRPADNLAKWIGGGWQAFGGGVDNTVIRMAVFDDGTGPGLYVGGAFASVDTTNPVVVNQIARWDIQGWHALSGGVAHPTVTTVSGLQVFNDGRGESLFVAGGFVTAGGQTSNNIVRWGCAPCYADCDGSGALNVLDFVCFQSRFAAGNGYANCDLSTTPPVLNVNDFVCFQAQFAAGCP